MPIMTRPPVPPTMASRRGDRVIHARAVPAAGAQVLSEAGLDKTGHPEIEAAERPSNDAFMACVGALSGGPGPAAEELASALEATAHGHAMLLLDSGQPPAADEVERTAERAARATRALIESRGLLSDAAGPAGLSRTAHRAPADGVNRAMALGDGGRAGRG